MTALLHYFELLLNRYGYGVVGVVVMLEAMGLPLPAESLIIGSSLYAATTHKMEIHWIAAAAVIGAILGDNFGYLIGRALGFRLLRHYGRKVGLTDKRLMLGRYLFKRHGGIVVFFGRFVAILRMFVALLAGANHMPWTSFSMWNALGAIAWAGGYSFCTYILGREILSLSGPVGIGAGIVGVIAIGAAFVFLKRNEERLSKQAQEEAEKDPSLRLT